MNDADEFAGQGGSYLVAKDGTKTLVHRTADAIESAPEHAAEPAPEKPAQKKEKN